MRPLLLTLFAIVALAGCGPQTTGSSSSNSESAHIEVQGVAEINAVPDRFILRVVFTETGKNVAALKNKLDKQMTDALAAASALGIDEKKLQASALSVQPEWQWQPERKLIGQRVSRDLHVSVDGMENYIALLERLTALSPSELQQAGTEVSELSSLEDHVLQQAVLNARHRADILANAANRQLGEAIIIIEQGTQLPGPQPLRAIAMERMAENSSYSAGEITLRSQVLVRFQLK